MLQFVIAGLVLGGIYAICSAGLVITYTSSGILNFAFGAMAFFIARFYYFLNTQHTWSILPAARPLHSGGVARARGVPLLRPVPASAPVLAHDQGGGDDRPARGHPGAAVLIFGNQAIQSAPGLAPQPVAVYQVFGVAVTLDQVIVYACVLATVIVGRADPALHRRRAQGAGDGRLARP